MPGTSIYSVLYYGAALIVLVLGAWFLIGVWRRFAKATQQAIDKEWPRPSWVAPVISTILVVVVLIVVLTIGWNVKQSITTHSSRYENPAEQSEKKAIEESRLPSQEEMDRVRSEQKQRAQDKPHQDALESFDQRMKQEATKIRKRSLSGSEPATKATTSTTAVKNK